MSKEFDKKIKYFVEDILCENLLDYEIILENGNITLYNKPKFPTQSIYVLSDQYNRIKIGISKDIQERKKAFLTSGLHTVIEYQTRPIKNAKNIEQKIHSYLKNNNIVGEWFNIDTQKAINIVKNFVNILPKDDCEHGETMYSFTESEFNRLCILEYFVPLDMLLKNDMFLLRASKEQLKKRIKELFYKDHEKSSYFSLEYSNLQFALYTYFIIMQEKELFITKDIMVYYEVENPDYNFFVYVYDALKNKYVYLHELTHCVSLLREDNSKEKAVI